MKLHYKIKEKNGYQYVVGKKNNKGLKLIDLAILRLQDNQNYKSNTNQDELVIVILEGRCKVLVDGKEIGVLKRKNVFEEKASSIYVPIETSFEVKAERFCELALCYSKADKKYPARFISKNEVEILKRGEKSFKRKIANIAVDNISADRILVGETFTPSGNWSSYPPHKHDEDKKDEIKLEEIYFYKINPAHQGWAWVNPHQGFALQRVYKNNFDKVFVIKNNVAIIFPFGYHPVVTAPGYDLYYLWILAGKKRMMKPKDDPMHTWVGKGLTKI